MATLTKLENLAAWLAAKASTVAGGAVIAVLAIIVADHYLGFAQGLPPRWLRGLGKGLGETAGSLTLIAVAYYLGREAAAAALKRGAVPQAAVPTLRSALRLLRLTHPLAGAAIVAAAALHGYLLWDGRLPTDEISGLAALLLLVILFATGLSLAGSRGAGFRKGHRLAGVAFLLLLALHKLIAD
ncbi:MAG: hypothetical protein RIN56_17525 [Sporomusaceae bacterium]|nr:hypothetical protein [Sporomusaceae bacterium]